MTDSKKYSHKLARARAIIIGASPGTGYCVAEASLEFGASVIISSSQQCRIDSSTDQLLMTYPSAKGRIADHACDLSSSSVEAHVERLFDHIVHTAGDHLATLTLGDANLESISKANAPKYLNPGPASSIILTTRCVSGEPE
ncbi:MAG: hypothetical protein Q9175_002923 [Cornicularia normoerica]